MTNYTINGSYVGMQRHQNKQLEHEYLYCMHTRTDSFIAAWVGQMSPLFVIPRYDMPCILCNRDSSLLQTCSRLTNLVL